MRLGCDGLDGDFVEFGGLRVEHDVVKTQDIGDFLIEQLVADAGDVDIFGVGRFFDAEFAVQVRHCAGQECGVLAEYHHVGKLYGLRVLVGNRARNVLLCLSHREAHNQHHYCCKNRFHGFKIFCC